MEIESVLAKIPKERILNVEYKSGGLRPTLHFYTFPSRVQAGILSEIDSEKLLSLYNCQNIKKFALNHKRSLCYQQLTTIVHRLAPNLVDLHWRGTVPKYYIPPDFQCLKRLKIDLAYDDISQFLQGAQSTLTTLELELNSVSVNKDCFQFANCLTQLPNLKYLNIETNNYDLVVALNLSKLKQKVKHVSLTLKNVDFCLSFSKNRGALSEVDDLKLVSCNMGDGVMKLIGACSQTLQSLSIMKKACLTFCLPNFCMMKLRVLNVERAANVRGLSLFLSSCPVLQAGVYIIHTPHSVGGGYINLGGKFLSFVKFLNSLE